MASKKSAVRKKAKGAYHHGDLKTTLKSAALRLVLEKGPRGFSLNEASRLAGVTVAAPYRHFEDKDALLAEIATDGFMQLATIVREAAHPAVKPEERLQQAGLAYLHFASQHRDYFAVMFSAGLEKAKYLELANASREAFGTILTLITEIERDGKLALQQAVACWALVHGLATLHADGAFAPSGEHGIPVQTPALLAEFVKKITTRQR